MAPSDNDPFDRLRNRHGERLDTAWTPGADAATGAGNRVVVIAHGVTSHHDRPWLVAVAEALGARGIPSLRLSFSGNGKSEGRYEDSTISKEVQDLRDVVDALTDAGYGGIGYVGHSMGGAVGVLATAGDPRIRALVSLAGMTHVQAFVERHFGDLVPGRDVLMGKPHCPLSQAYLDDCRAVGDVLEAAALVAVPWLLLHGDADELVPLRDALDAKGASKHAELVSFEGVDHRFRGHEQETARIAAEWLDRELE